MESADTPESGSDRTAMRRGLFSGIDSRCLVALVLGYALGVNGIDLFTLL